MHQLHYTRLICPFLDINSNPFIITGMNCLPNQSACFKFYTAKWLTIQMNTLTCHQHCSECILNIKMRKQKLKCCKQQPINMLHLPTCSKIMTSGKWLVWHTSSAHFTQVQNGGIHACMH